MAMLNNQMVRFSCRSSPTSKVESAVLRVTNRLPAACKGRWDPWSRCRLGMVEVATKNDWFWGWFRWGWVLPHYCLLVLFSLKDCIVPNGCHRFHVTSEAGVQRLGKRNSFNSNNESGKWSVATSTQIGTSIWNGRCCWGHNFVHITSPYGVYAPQNLCRLMNNIAKYIHPKFV